MTRLLLVLVFVGFVTPTFAAEPTPESTPSPEPTPAPESTPSPEPTEFKPPPRRGPLPAATAASHKPRRPAHDRYLRLELSITPESTFFASASPAATTSGDAIFTPTVRVGLGLTEHVVVSLGYRAFSAMNRADLGYDLTTSGDALVATARYELPLTRVFALAAELDLEATRLAYELAVGSLSGSTSTWGFGAIPRLAIITRASLGPITLDFRFAVGFALRLDHEPELRLGSSADRVTPIDLGALNLSGLSLGATVALSF